MKTKNEGLRKEEKEEEEEEEESGDRVATLMPLVMAHTFRRGGKEGGITETTFNSGPQVKRVYVFVLYYLHEMQVLDACIASFGCLDNIYLLASVMRSYRNYIGILQ